MLLKTVQPMGIYKTLGAFLESTGLNMGEAGTHPWMQGFPRVTPLPNGPGFPNLSSRTAQQRLYPKAWGEPELREAIARYYRERYDVNLTALNVMVVGGGRPGLNALLMFLERDVDVRVASTEYTPYLDMLRCYSREFTTIESNEANRFAVSAADYFGNDDQRRIALFSNPCNPTAVVLKPSVLEDLVSRASGNFGVLSDEAYEWFVEGEPMSALQFTADINDSNLFVVGATTKGCQDPGLRIGWVIASEEAIDTLGAFSSFGMGGVSRPSQLEAIKLLDPNRVQQSIPAVSSFYQQQRQAYGDMLEELGFELFSGTGGFYHWCKLPGDLLAADFNRRLFTHNAAILEGTYFDMQRTDEAGYRSPLENFIRFSFGPIEPGPAYLEQVREIIQQCLACTPAT
jgi:aminotransferase